jgi:hypothetical protein
MPLFLLIKHDESKRSGRALFAFPLLLLRNLLQMDIATFLQVAAVESDV